MAVFSRADILLPKTADLHSWAVIACDQFTSDAAYWQRVRALVGKQPSTLHLILPEAELGTPMEAEHTAQMGQTMDRYLAQEQFVCRPDSYIYVERTLENGSVRKGLLGKVDLEAYDYRAGSDSLIRATEKTVVERIPPRLRVRRAASVELPHILMLCDDHERLLLEPLEAEKDRFELLYDFDLMEGGGHICGRLVSDAAAAAFDARLAAYADTYTEKYRGLRGTPMLFAVGDGNHSLATAKAFYEELKKAHPGEDLSRHPARYALVELENLHDAAQVFEPIHRIVAGTDAEALLKALQALACADGGFPVQWVIGGKKGTVTLDRAKGELAVAVLQSFLDDYLADHRGTIDYIHDDEALLKLAEAPDSIGFLLPPMEKSQLFRGVIADGALPRKTFSMGHAREKRYYLEARRIR